MWGLMLNMSFGSGHLGFSIDTKQIYGLQGTTQ